MYTHSTKPPIAIAFMEYPHPQLPFADSDLEALQEQGLKVVPIALRGRHFIAGNIFSRLHIARKLFSADIWSIAASVGWSGMRDIFCCGDQLLDIIKAALLLPRTLVAISYLKQNQVNHLHLFWGHYPSVMGIAWKLLDDAHRLTISLGAYDLEKELKISIRAAEIANRVTTHSQFNRHRLVSEWGIEESKVVTIYRGVDLKLFRAGVHTNGRADQLKVISVGRLIKDKNVELTLDMFAALKRSSPEARLVIAGSGPDLKRLDRIAKNKGLSDSCEFVGHLRHDSLRQLMQSSDLHIFTSVKPGEILPNAVKESMACGVIPVVLRHPAIEELIDDGLDGFLMSSDSEIGAIVEKILRADLPAMSENAKNKIGKRFDRIESATQFTALCLEIEQQPENAQIA